MIRIENESGTPGLYGRLVSLVCLGLFALPPESNRSLVSHPMGNAIGAATAVSKAAFTHGKSKTRFAILGRDKEVVQQIERGGLSAEYRVAY